MLTESSAQAFKTTISAQGVVDGNGNLDIQFPEAAAGTYYTGSVTIYDAPLSANFNVLINGGVIDQVLGAATISPVQVGQGDLLEFTASNLLGFAGQTFHGTFHAIVTPQDGTELVVPGHDPLTVTGQGLAQGTYMGHFRNGPTVQTLQQVVPIPPNSNYIVAFVQGGNLTNTLLVQGVNTGWATLNVAAINGVYIGYIPVTLETQLTLRMVNNNVGTITDFWFFAFSAAPAGAVFQQQPIPVINETIPGFSTPTPLVVQGVSGGGGTPVPVTIPNPSPVTFPSAQPVTISTNPVPVEGIQGPQSDAVKTTPTDPSVHTTHSSFAAVAPAAGTATPLLSAPSSGKCWEIIDIFAVTNNVATSTNILFVGGVTSGQTFWEPLQISGQTFYGEKTMAGPLYINEGLTCHTAAGAAITFFVIARQVPLV